MELYTTGYIKEKIFPELLRTLIELLSIFLTHSMFRQLIHKAQRVVSVRVTAIPSRRFAEAPVDAAEEAFKAKEAYLTSPEGKAKTRETLLKRLTLGAIIAMTTHSVLYFFAKKNGLLVDDIPDEEKMQVIVDKFVSPAAMDVMHNDKNFGESLKALEKSSTTPTEVKMYKVNPYALQEQAQAKK